MRLLFGRSSVVTLVSSPVNLVDSYTNRWSFAFAFGSMSIGFILLAVTKDLIILNDVDVMLQGKRRNGPLLNIFQSLQGNSLVLDVGLTP